MPCDPAIAPSTGTGGFERAAAAIPVVVLLAGLAILTYLFSPGIWWRGLRVNRWGSFVHVRQIVS